LDSLFRERPAVHRELLGLAPGQRYVVSFGQVHRGRSARSQRGRSFVFTKGEDQRIYLISFIAKQLPR